VRVDRFIECIVRRDRDHRRKDLGAVDLHLRCRINENGRGEEGAFAGASQQRPCTRLYRLTDFVWRMPRLPSAVRSSARRRSRRARRTVRRSGRSGCTGYGSGCGRRSAGGDGEPCNRGADGVPDVCITGIQTRTITSPVRGNRVSATDPLLRHHRPPIRNLRGCSWRRGLCGTVL